MYRRPPGVAAYFLGQVEQGQLEPFHFRIGLIQAAGSLPAWAVAGLRRGAPAGLSASV
jgi:hypothetical protein